MYDAELLSDHVNDVEEDEEVDQDDEECDDAGNNSLLDGRFDEIDSSDNSRPGAEEGDQNFEDLIAQEEVEETNAIHRAKDSTGDKLEGKQATTGRNEKKDSKSAQAGNKGRKGNNEANSDEYLYQLVGVLVHSGSANSGHYYSYIKERSSGQPGRWLEFNDRIVKEFDFANLAKECFGTPPEKRQ